MPRIKTFKKPAAKKPDPARNRLADEVANLSERVDALVAALNKALNIDVEPGA